MVEEIATPAVSPPGQATGPPSRPPLDSSQLLATYGDTLEWVQAHQAWVQDHRA